MSLRSRSHRGHQPLRPPSLEFTVIEKTIRQVREGHLTGWATPSLEAFLAELRGLLSEVPVSLHPLGFVHFELTDVLGIPDGARVRAHLWDPALSPPDPAGGIHDHTWHLKSGVLFGSVRNSTFRAVPDGAGPLLGSRVSYGVQNVFRPAGRFRLDAIETQTVDMGSCYGIPSRIVHSSELLSSQAFTLVLGEPDALAEEVGPLLLTKESKPPVGTEQRRSLGYEEAEHLLLDFMAMATS